MSTLSPSSTPAGSPGSSEATPKKVAQRSTTATRRIRRVTGLVGLLVTLGVAIIASLAFGAREMPLNTLFDSIGQSFVALRDPAAVDSSSDAWVIAQLRVPRTVLGLFVGAGLGVAGALIQGHTRNPLADPGLLGISAGAAFAVVLSFTVFGISSTLPTMFVAFAGALAATALVFGLTTIGSGTVNPVSVILGGAALSAVLSAATQAFVLMDNASLDRMRFWTVGALTGRDLSISAYTAPVIIMGIIVAFMTASQLNLLNLGDDIASSLGVNTNMARLLGMGLIALLAGVGTAAAGPIGFVGLVVPHVIRTITGPDYKWILPYSALGGAALLVLADVAGRVIARPGELQVGLALAFVGAPFMLWLIARRRMVKL